MQRILARYEIPLFTLLRIVAGFLFWLHGAQKLFGWFGGQRVGSDPLMLTAGVIEFFGGLLIAFGLLTGIAGLLASGEMAVAYFKAHAPSALLPIQNHGELAAIYSFLFLYVASHGAGPISFDRVLFGPPRMSAKMDHRHAA